MKTALLAVDLVNPFDFEGAGPLLRQLRRVVPAIARLLAGARRTGAPLVYCNDNFGQWRSDFHANVAACAGEGARGADVVRRMLPEPGDYFVLKPRHSVFYATPLDFLLEQLRVQRLLLCGIATDSCILQSALSAVTRGYEVAVVADAVAAQSATRTRRALDLLRSDEPRRVIRTRTALKWLQFTREA